MIVGWVTGHLLSPQAAVWSRPWKLRPCTLPGCWGWRSTRGPWILVLMQVRTCLGLVIPCFRWLLVARGP